MCTAPAALNDSDDGADAAGKSDEEARSAAQARVSMSPLGSPLASGDEADRAPAQGPDEASSENGASAAPVDPHPLHRQRISICARLQHMSPAVARSKVRRAFVQVMTNAERQIQFYTERWHGN